MKTHTTAVCLIPPKPVWEPIQRVRRRYDRQFNRWMPHINLLYPFVLPAEFNVARRILASVCGRHVQFRITLREFRSFSHGARSHTIWLAPEPAEPIIRLQAALQESFPDCTDLSRFGGGFTPHLSLGQAGSRTQLEERLKELRESWVPLEFTVRKAYLIRREGSQPFEVDTGFPLTSPET